MNVSHARSWWSFVDAYKWSKNFTHGNDGNGGGNRERKIEWLSKKDGKKTANENIKTKNAKHSISVRRETEKYTFLVDILFLFIFVLLVMSVILLCVSNIIFRCLVYCWRLSFMTIFVVLWQLFLNICSLNETPRRRKTIRRRRRGRKNCRIFSFLVCVTKIIEMKNNLRWNENF